MDETTELLDRQVAFLLRQKDDAAFLIQIDSFLRALRTDARLAAYLEDALTELAEIVSVMAADDLELSAELVALRAELVMLWPDADDSDAVLPATGPSRTLEQIEFEGTLAFFDTFAASEPVAFNADAIGGIAGTLLKILQGKYSLYTQQFASRRGVGGATSGGETPKADGPESATQTARSPVDHDALEDWVLRLASVDRVYDRATRWMRLRTQTSGGYALLRLQQASESLNPDLKLFGPGRTSTDVANDTLRWVASEEYSLFKAVDPGSQLSESDGVIVARRVAGLRLDAERLGEDLRRRVGAARSSLAMVNRFKMRSEWFDRSRMIDVANDTSLAGHPEDRLTAEFARFLFDQGLSPITKPITGGLQPDLLDPLAGFYVEAKQYSSDSARGDIIDSVAQVLDTVGRLRGTPYAVREAFCVIFRRKGPYYDLSENISTETFRLHLVLVDLADPKESGTRQKTKPVHIGSSEFIAAYAELAKSDDPAPVASDEGETDTATSS